ncbi:MAG: 50S ribosomal protein L17 [Deltaproteobacteria bacterium]|nr:50S ribosomal protein L17 [Deltaproteobacteria bacterium]MBI4196452.1 50S ribosomal protein L17 [Deltaproteobacteria bacterium]
MRHLVDHRKLGRTTSHRKAMLRNMVTSLVLHERLETTLPKAKELRRLADRMITWGKEGGLAARRQAARVLQSPEALKKLFNGLAKRFEDRQGGYTRILHFGFRRGDGAPMAAIEYLGYETPQPLKREEKKGEKQKTKKVVPEKKVSTKAGGKEPAKKKQEGKKDKKGWGLFSRKKKNG